jgi:hypothetical protein
VAVAKICEIKGQKRTLNFNERTIHPKKTAGRCLMTAARSFLVSLSIKISARRD